MKVFIETKCYNKHGDTKKILININTIVSFGLSDTKTFIGWTFPHTVKSIYCLETARGGFALPISEGRKIWKTIKDYELY